MRYDITSKVIFERCKGAILRFLCKLDIAEIEDIEELPQETVSLRRSDFVVKVRDREGKLFVCIIEFIQRWEKYLPLRTLEYRCRHKLKEKLPVITIIFVFLSGGDVKEEYEDEEVRYRYRVVKLYEIEAKDIIERGEICLYPFVPLMKGGEEYVEEVEERIYKAGGFERGEKADLLTGLAILTGLKDREKARKLIERRRDIMIESAAYEIIKQEGFKEGYDKGILKGREEGLREGILKGIREGLLKGIELGLEVRFGAEGLALYPEIKKIKNVDVLETISEAIKTAKSLEEIEKLCKKLYSL
jgi:hypothetical protein